MCPRVLGPILQCTVRYSAKFSYTFNDFLRVQNYNYRLIRNSMKTAELCLDFGFNVTTGSGTQWQFMGTSDEPQWGIRNELTNVNYSINLFIGKVPKTIPRYLFCYNNNKPLMRNRR